LEQCQAALQHAPNDEIATYHLLISLRHAGKKDEQQPLVKRLAELHQQSLQTETDRKRYTVVEQLPTPTQAHPTIDLQPKARLSMYYKVRFEISPIGKATRMASDFEYRKS
jgi:hypothetical protein